MRRSYSHSSSYTSPSPSVSTVSSWSSISGDDLDDDFVDLNSSQNVDTRDYILVIGGLGFIGSHTTLELLKEGYNVVIVDNMSNSHDSAFTNIQRLASKYRTSKGLACPHLKLHKVDYRSHMMRTILGRYVVQDAALSATRLCHITGVIHFAAYKSVEESTKKPLQYYQNNVSGLIDLLAVLGDFGIQNFVFSSSATVYGSILSEGGRPVCEEQLVHHEAVDEHTTPLVSGVRGLTSPYGRTKYFSEAVLADVAFADPSWRITALRYFNPVGCESSGTLGEDPRQEPTNLFPVITQVLKGERPSLDIFGSDWDTCDGTAVRDYIHVVDLARGHLAALAAAGTRPAEIAFRAYNLGTGKGSTVAQVVSSMEKAASRLIPVRQTGRRTGDVGFCVASTERAERELGWKTQLSLDECATDSWRRVRSSVQNML
jgi:UDP-glucose 4-epimerase